MKLLTFSKTLLFSLVLTSFLEAKMLSRTQVIMSTFVTISTEEKNSQLIEDAFNIVKDIDNSISTYNKNSTIYKLNENLFKIGLDKYSYEALTLSQRYYKRTDGYFDISIGSITKKMYKFGEDERVPSKDELSGAIVGLKGLHVEKAKACMEYGMQVDLGGMGKGYAVDKVAQYFRDKGVLKAKIALSGDIRCLSTCSVKVQDPFSEGYIFSFKTKKADLGITTSGNYNRFVEDKKNNHLIDPKAKKSQGNFASITLIGAMPNADLDAYATAASVMPVKKAYEFLDSLGVGYIVVEIDKKIVKSKNLDRFAYFGSDDLSSP